MVDVAIDLSRTFLTNYPEFPDSSSRLQFTFLVNILQVLINGSHILLKQFSHQRLC
jgi:hypothetical protein